MKKSVILLSLSFLSALCLAACANDTANDDSAASKIAATEYDYTYDRPFYSTPDENMKIDGEFDEKEWQDCTWMQTTQYDVTYKITTLFTSKGIYVAAYAEDSNIIFNGRNNFINNSSFEIQIVKENASVYSRSNRWSQHYMSDYMFHADSQTCRSYRERNFNGAVKCVGEPNSGNTTSLSYEMFMDWDQMNYDESELDPQTGMPESVRIWCQYIRVDKSNAADTKYISPFLMDYGIYPSYYEYGAKGLVNSPDNGTLGSAKGGTTCTDRWILNEETGAVSVDLYQTQHIWFNHDGDGNEISRPRSFIAEAKVTADVNNFTSGQATFGIMTIHDMGNMVTYGVNMSQLMNGKVTLESIEGIDSSYWVGQLSMITTVESDYTENSICLRLIKIDGYYYYFYKSPQSPKYIFAGYEYFYKNDGEVDVGLFTNCPTTISDYRVYDYTDDEEVLMNELTKTVYSIDNSDVSGGVIDVSDTVIRKGASVTVTATPNNGYVLNSLHINGENKFSEFVDAGGNLVITPDSDVKIKAKFVRIPTEYCKEIEFAVKDSAGGAVSNADYVIKNTNPLFSRSGATGGQGNIKSVMPGKGTFEINGVTYVCDGEYLLTLNKKSFKEKIVTFELSANVSQTVVMEDTLWGKSLSVNGKRVNDSYGELKYDAEKDLYYAENNGVREYYTNTKTTSGEYLYECTITTAPLKAVTVNPVVGMVISSGTSQTTLNIKSAWWETNRICIEIDGREISVSGFTHSLNNNNADSLFSVKVARLNNVLYVYDGGDNLIVRLDATGVYPAGDRKIVNTSGLAYIQTQLKAFFGNGIENVCGPLVIDGSGARVDFSLSAVGGAEEFVTGGRITLVAEGFEVETGKDLSSYIRGDEVKLSVKSTDPSKIILSLTLKHEGGSKDIEGTYNIASGKTEFSFIHIYGSVTVTVCDFTGCHVVSGTVTGTSDYGSVTVVAGGSAAGTYTGLVGKNGGFSFTVPQGSLGLAFVCGNKLAVTDIVATSSLNGITAELKTNELLLGNVTLNGKAITSKATLDYEIFADIAACEKVSVSSTLYSKEFGNAERREYAALLTSSVSSLDMSVKDVLSTTVAYGKAGLAITDGEKMLCVQLGTGDNANILIVSFGDWGEGGRFNLNVQIANITGTGITGSGFSDIALELIKTQNGIEIKLNSETKLTVDNEELGNEFFKPDREYCFALASTNLAGNIYNEITLFN